jgi:hypothetical protein
MAIASSAKLTPIAASTPTEGQSRVKPSVLFRHDAQTISNSPATTR